MRVRSLRRIDCVALVAAVSLWSCTAAAQTAAPNSPLPKIPSATQFRPEAAPASAAQHAAMIRIPAGSYLIGSPAQHPLADASATPEHRVMIKAFKIDRTEVTNEQYAEFMNHLPVKPSGTAPGGKVSAENIPREYRALFLEFSSRPAPYTMIDLDDAEALIGVRNGRFVPNRGFERHPVTETTWAGARVYCEWRGARLPTEVEWEAAARGAENRTFPWGDASPTPERAVINRPSGDILAVGSRPGGATPEGLLDMAGSLLEWTSSLKRPYPYRADDGREDQTTPGVRTVRGGNYVFDDAPNRLTTWSRTAAWDSPATGHRQIGFRCASDS